MDFHVLLVVFLPLVGFLFCGFILLVEMLNKIKINSTIPSVFVIVSTFISAVLSLKLFYMNTMSSFVINFDFKYKSWICLNFLGQENHALLNTKSEFFYFLNNLFSNSNLFVFNTLLELKWGFLIDPLASTMLLVITFVSLLVQLYAFEYMSHDVNRTRFMSYLSLFVFFMIILVTSDNFIQMFIGWEGVGLVSYLLISFWYTRVEAARSALKAIGVNKIGDFGLVMAIVLIFFTFGTVDYDLSFYYSNFIENNYFVFLGYNVNIFTAIGFWLLVAATGKSAQLGLHTWLPDAMEGPTPVSALIHAATMVTAGVYLLVRCSPIIEKSPIILVFITFIGATTALFGASTALFQNDLKKIIAYSTCSQLGYMVFACGLSAYSVAMFHLVNHAFFKALLFLCAGSVIHAMSDEQDIRKMGGLAKILPFTYSTMLIGSCSLAGFPFLSGYYSKDLILEVAGSTYSTMGYYSYTMGLLAAFFTTLYSIRLTYLTFLTKTNSFKQVIEQAKEPSVFMVIPLFVLGILSIVSGKYLFPVFIGKDGLINYSFWQNSIYLKVSNLGCTADIHQLAVFYKLLPTIIVSSAIVLGVIFYYLFSYELTKFFFSSVGREIYYFFNKKWYFDMIYSKFVIRFFYLFGYNTMFKAIDRGLLNFITIPVLVDGMLGMVRLYKTFHSGYIYTYIFMIMLSTLLIFYIFL